MFKSINETALTKQGSYIPNNTLTLSRAILMFATDYATIHVCMPFFLHWAPLFCAWVYLTTWHVV